jgi:protein-S-isoprenylcysteine O-methyltransferase Ste14
MEVVANMGIFRVFDWPPVWLAGCVLLAWLTAMPVAGGAAALVLAGLGGAGVALGLGLMGLAVREMARARTTVVPGRDPSALVTGGVFRLSRNPIYLGDLLVLAGVSLAWQSWVGLVLVPVLGRILARRFIEDEEARLRAGFGAEAEAWMARVRRWL